MEGFELFKVQSINRVVDKITVTKNFQINFPSAFYKKHSLGDKAAVRLYFNKNTKQVAMVFVETPDENSFKISAPNGGKNGGYITAKKFFALNDVADIDYAHRYDYVSRDDSIEDGTPARFFIISLAPETQ